MEYRAKGGFHLNGKYNSNTKRIDFTPRDWIERPPGYNTVGMNGIILDNPKRYEGNINNNMCGSFSVIRTEL